MEKHTPCTISLDSLIKFKCVETGIKDYSIVRRLPKGPEVKIKKQFIIDEHLSWCIGFYLAEGSKMKTALGISNSYFPILIKFKNFIENYFSISESDWFVSIHTNTKNEQSINRINALFKPKRTYVYENKLATKDNVEIRINNVVIAEVFHNLVVASLNLIKKDNKLILAFLRAYEIGDGSINVRKNCLHSINITVKDKAIKDFLKEIFYKVYKINLNERRTKDAYEIYLCNVKYITSLIIDGHFRDEKRQWDKFVRGYKNKEYVRSHLRYWKVLDKPLSINLIAKRTDRSHWSVRDALNADERSGLVVSSYRKLNKCGHAYKFYGLTKRGKQLVDILQVD